MDISIRSILFPTDFSDAAKSAQDYAVGLAEKFGASLHVLHVVTLSMTDPHSATPWVTVENQMRLRAELANQRLAQELSDHRVHEHKVIHASMVGFEVEEIVKYSKVHEIDLIVMGTHGRTGLKHFLLGSVAEKTVRMASCPVMTVQPTGHRFVGPEVASKSVMSAT